MGLSTPTGREESPSPSDRGLDKGDDVGAGVTERRREVRRGERGAEIGRFRKQLATFEPVQHGARASERQAVIV